MDSAERYRPQFHFTPERNWMNDPNGLVYHDGEYHLFYQYNPYGTSHGHMSWGHAVSPDLIRWTHLPVALMEEPENSRTMFSGSAVVDRNNTTGFGDGGEPPIVAVYTADHRPDKLLQDIHIAYSTDRGRTFTKYEGNPVLDVNDRKFGDPKVFWHEPTGQWIMVNILGWGQGRVVLHGSPDLKAWEFLSEFAAPEEAPGKWECPDLFPLAVDGDPANVKWVLKVNATGSARSRYFVGDFDGRTFRPETVPDSELRFDHGNFYAEVTYNDIPASDGRAILMGWIVQQPSDARPWAGMQSIPRSLTLRSCGGELRVCQAPVAELASLRGEHIVVEDEAVPEDCDLLSERGVPAGELEILLEFAPAPVEEFGVEIRLGDESEVVAGYSVGAEELFVDCTSRERIVAPLPLREEAVRLHVLIDRSVVEVFGGDGEAAITAVLEPDPVCAGVELRARGGTAQLKRMDLWPLGSGLAHA